MQGRELLKAERAPFYQMQLRGQLGTERLQGDLQQDPLETQDEQLRW